MENPHSNVGSAMARLEKIRNEENNKKNQIEKSVRNEQQFMVEISERIVDVRGTKKIDGVWETKHGRLTFKVDGRILTGFGKTETKKTPAGDLFGLFVGKSAPQQAEYTETTKIELSGTLTGCAFKYKIKFSRAPRPSLLSGDYEVIGFGYYDNTMDALVTMEDQDDKKVRETIRRSGSVGLLHINENKI